MTLAEWTAAWNYLWREAQDRYATVIAANPKAYEPQVTSFVQELQSTRAQLDILKKRLSLSPSAVDAATYNRLAREHYELSTRFYSDTRPAQKPELGFAPIMIVLGIAIGVAASAWAVAGWEYARSLRERTALAGRELEARIAASREGRQLQPSTLPAEPPPSSPLEGLKNLGGVLAVGGLVAAAFYLLPTFKKS